MAQLTVEVRGDNRSQNTFRQVERDIDNLDRTQRVFARSTISGAIGITAQFAAASAVIETFRRTVEGLTSGAINVAANFQSVAATLTALGENGEVVAAQLRDISRIEDGLTFDNLAKTVAQLRSAGAPIRDATDLVRGFARQLAITNASAEDQTRFFVQLRQAYAGNVAEGNDLRTIFEVMPQLLNIGTQALGIQLNNWKDLRTALEQAGISLREFLQQSGEIAGQAIIDPDQFRIQQERLSESIEQLQRVIGERLLPVVTEATKGLVAFFDAISGDLTGFRNFAIGTTAVAAGLVAFRATVVPSIKTVIDFNRWMQTSSLSTDSFRSVVSLTAQTLNATTIPALKATIASVINMNIVWQASIPIIAVATVAIGAIAVAMRNAAQGVTSFEEALANIGRGIRFDETLGRVRRFSDFTRTELRQGINRLISERERLENEIQQIESSQPGGAARGIGAAFDRLDSVSRGTQSLEELRVQLRIVTRQIELFEKQLTEQATESVNEATEAFTGLSAQIVRTTSLVNRLQFAFDNARTTGIAEDLRDRFITEAIGLADLQHRRAEDIEDAERRAAEVARIESTLFDRIIRINRAFRQRQNQDTRDAADAQREILRSIGEQQIAAIEDAAQSGTQFAAVLRSIESVVDRRRFFQLVQELQDQGQAFDEALANAQRYFTTLQDINSITIELARRNREGDVLGFEIAAEQGRTLTDVLRELNTVAARREVFRLFQEFREQGQSVEEAARAAQSFVENLTNLNVDRDFAAGAAAAAEAERRAFEDINPGDITDLERLRIQARTEGLAFVRRIFRDNLRQEEADLQESINRQYRLYQRFYTNVSDLAIAVVFRQVDDFREAAAQFIIAAIRDFARLEIARRFTAAREIAIDTAVTNARIANQRRLQATIQQTQAAQIASAAGGVGTPGLPIPNLNLPSLLTGGGGALSVVGALFPTELSNLTSGIGNAVSRAVRNLVQVDPVSSTIEIENTIKLDDGTIRRQSDRQRVNANRRR